MPAPRLRLAPRSIALAVATVSATLVVLRLVGAAERVLGWIAAAGAVAGLLHGLVRVVGRRVPRGAAVATVFIATLLVTGGVLYLVADDVVSEMHSLEAAIPRRAADIERRGPFKATARDLHLTDRATRFVGELPERLRGGTPVDALRSAASRGVAFLATSVLSLFLLLHGPRLVRSAIEQLPDAARRAEVSRIVRRSYQRAFGYARGSLAMSFGVGIVTYTLLRAADLPGPAPLALWAAAWDLVPIIGFAVGALPIAALAAVTSPLTGGGLAAFFLAYQALESTVLQPRLEAATLRVGPFVTVGAALLGLELYGIGGALLVPLVAAVAMAALDEATAA